MTIRDIAKKFDVSTATVSLSLSNNPLVNEKTKAMIVAYAKEIGYRPNRLARGLVSGKSKTIGIITPSLQNPYYAQLLELLLEDLEKKHSYDGLVLHSYGDLHDFQKKIDFLEQIHVDGMILVPPFDTPQNFFDSLKTPVVVYSNDPFNVSRIDLDRHKAVSLAFDRFEACGAEKIAYIGNIIKGHEIYEEYLQQMIQRKWKQRSEWIYPSRERFLPDVGSEAFKSFFAIKNPPQAVLCMTPSFAVGLTLTALIHHKTIPQDLKVIGIGKTNDSLYSPVSLTLADFPLQELSQNLLETIFRNIDKKTNPKSIQKIQPHLHLGMSC